MHNDPVFDFAERIATTFSVKPRRHGREWRVPCPVHEADGVGHNPSLAVWDRGGGLAAWKCLTGCPKDAVKAALKARGISAGGGPVSPEAQYVAKQTQQQRKDDATVKAFELVKASRFVEHGSPAYSYLASRGLSHGSEEPALRASTDPLFDEHGHALLAVICDLTTMQNKFPRATGIQTLSLNSDGTPRLDAKGKKLRSILGVQQGYAVPLGDPHATTLLVGEGIESVLAAMQLLDMPFGAAVLSASNMAPLIVPEWIEEVVIAADNDDPGKAGAYALRAPLRDCDTPCRIEMWGELGSGWDAADEWMRRSQ